MNRPGTVLAIILLSYPMSNFFYIAANATRQGGGGGIYLCKLADDGAMSVAHHNDQLEKVMYITRSESNPSRIYASTALKENSAIAGFNIDKSSYTPFLINQQPAGGASPCYVEIIDKSAFVANYAGGHVSVFPIDKQGKLKQAAQVINHCDISKNHKPNITAHPHSIVTTPDGEYALSADLGLDEIFVYKINSQQNEHKLIYTSSEKTHKGAGPRHLIFKQAKNSTYVYVINELDATLSSYIWIANRAKLSHFQTISTLPKNINIKNSAADLHLHPNGKWLYASNRGHDSIAVMAIDSILGKVELIQNEPTQGSFPRGFILDPKGEFLIVGNEKSNSVYSFTINQNSGKLAPTGYNLDIPAPLYFTF